MGKIKSLVCPRCKAIIETFVDKMGNHGIRCRNCHYTRHYINGVK
jgi:hypothetical protein